MVYDNRIVRTEQAESTTSSFATRESSRNTQLDSIIDMVVHDDDSTDILAEFARDGEYS